MKTAETKAKNKKQTKIDQIEKGMESKQRPNIVDKYWKQNSKRTPSI